MTLPLWRIAKNEQIFHKKQFGSAAKKASLSEADLNELSPHEIEVLRDGFSVQLDSYLREHHQDYLDRDNWLKPGWKVQLLKHMFLGLGLFLMFLVVRSVLCKVFV